MSVTISVNEIERVAAETVQQPGIEDAHTSHCLDMVKFTRPSGHWILPKTNVETTDSTGPDMSRRYWHPRVEMGRGKSLSLSLSLSLTLSHTHTLLACRCF